MISQAVVALAKNTIPIAFKMRIIIAIALLHICIITPIAAESRYDRLAREYEMHPTQRTYDRLMREWWRVERHNRSLERRLVPVPTVKPTDRTCDGDYDARKQLNH